MARRPIPPPRQEIRNRVVDAEGNPLLESTYRERVEDQGPDGLVLIKEGESFTLASGEIVNFSQLAGPRPLLGHCSFCGGRQGIVHTEHLRICDGCGQAGCQRCLRPTGDKWLCRRCRRRHRVRAAFTWLFTEEVEQ